jgi:hypothetical protein
MNYANHIDILNVINMWVNGILLLAGIVGVVAHFALFVRV